jgi:heat shock transcription factor
MILTGEKKNSFLDDGKNTDLIRWADDGNSFIVLDEDEFAKTLIPELFKHNNYASFVRQLNMYGFHKKVGLSDNSMRASERKNKSPSEYSNPFFRRGHPDLLWLIQKPKNATVQGAKGKNKNKADSEQNDDDVEEYVEEAPAVQEGRPKFRGQLAIGHGEASLSREQLASVQRELATIRQQQQQISRMMASLKHEHQQLYGQAANFQDQHTRHENSINAILTFLATVYNRSLQGHDGAPGITNLFAGSIPRDSSPGSVVDVGDYSFDQLNGGDGTMPKPFKKQPLLLQAPPAENQPGRTSPLSPSSTAGSYSGRQTRRMSQALQTGSNGQAGNVQELFGSSASTPAAQVQTAGPSSRHPQRDIMSVIQSTNARNSLPGTPAADFSNVLTSLENAGGNGPLTGSQRAEMLRLINNSSNQAGDNALVSPNPPPQLNNYDRKLASTKADLDHLAKMQAEQDRSVQNLTNLLQPLSPSGSIPGIGDGTNVPPPPLDIEDILNTSGEYFGDFSGEGADYDFATNGSGFNFEALPEVDDGPLFGDVGTDDQQQEFDAFKGSHTEGDGGGRVESVTSSEVTTPPTAAAAAASADTESMPMKGRDQRYNENEGGKSPAKRRKRNA